MIILGQFGRYFRITVINFGVFTIHCPIFLMESGVLAGNLSCKFIKVLKECTSKHILIETFVLCPLDSINTSNHLVDLQLISSKFYDSSDDYRFVFSFEIMATKNLHLIHLCHYSSWGCN